MIGYDSATADFYSSLRTSYRVPISLVPYTSSPTPSTTSTTQASPEGEDVATTSCDTTSSLDSKIGSMQALMQANGKACEELNNGTETPEEVTQ
ncbi:hypothetical protein NX059_009522 [Plenodomus lindquistii]|nr:hypothetical protein NX059_009522 [Plenodomus lindquistii]